MGSYKEMKELGTLDKGVERVMAKVLPPTPYLYIKDSEVKKLGSTLDSADQILDNSIKVYGVPQNNQPLPLTKPTP
jgi:hypothetical protein